MKKAFKEKKLVHFFSYIRGDKQATHSAHKRAIYSNDGKNYYMVVDAIRMQVLPLVWFLEEEPSEFAWVNIGNRIEAHKLPWIDLGKQTAI